MTSHLPDIGFRWYYSPFFPALKEVDQKNPFIKDTISMKICANAPSLLLVEHSTATLSLDFIDENFFAL